MNLENYLIEWNLKFPLDRAYRKKHNIVFGSEQHRAISQLDLYFDHLEDQIYKKYGKLAEQEIEAKKQFDAGKWLKDGGEDISAEEEDRLFKMISISKIKESSIQIEE
jgi:hypothetical protein